jgi:hypothetical protein
MSSGKIDKRHMRFASVLAATLLAASAAVADEPERGVFVLTSTNDPSANEVVVFKFDTSEAPLAISAAYVAFARQGRRGEQCRYSAVQG